MNDSRSSTPEAPPQDLWSSILDSVSSSRSIPSKQILLLGQPSTGKSTLAAALLKKPVADETKVGLRTDFALGYDYADVRDDADEDTLARLSIYTVPSASLSHLALLPHFLPPKTSLPHTLVMIVLDWTRPWTFIDELLLWLEWVEKWAKGDGAREVEITREENRERLQHHIQHYTEPSADPIPAATSLPGADLPLGPGTLTHNHAGVPIIVACTRADLIDENPDANPGASVGGMVKGKGGEWEERIDAVMQVLRTICLKYGAALFYTTPLPETLHVLRQYALHFLCIPFPSSGVPTGPEATAPIRNPFPFQQKANTLDRDHIVIPAGWDSWGKVTIMRDNFDPKTWGEAWDKDLDDEDDQEMSGISAKKLYDALVPDQGVKPQPLPPFNSPIPEQQFLAKHYDENAKRADRDPRGAFRNPADLTAAAGIVGPLGSSSFDLPAVERALSEMEVASVPSLSSSVNGTDPRRVASRTTGTSRPGALSILGTSTTSAPSNVPGRTPISPNPNSAGPSGGQSQHEVLQKFFNSLLSSKDRASTTSPTTTRTKANGTHSGTEDGDT